MMLGSSPIGVSAFADATGSFIAANTSNVVSLVQSLISKNTGKWYTEILVSYSNTTTEQSRVGIVSSASPIQSNSSAILGNDPSSLGWSPTGQVIHNNYVSMANTYNSNDIICIASDFNNNRVWLRTNNGTWGDENNTANGVSDPTMQIGGIDISSMASENKFIASTLANGSSVSFNEIVYTPPTGFSLWINPPSFTNLTGFGNLPRPIGYAHANEGNYKITANAVLSLPNINGTIYSFNYNQIISGPCGDVFGINIVSQPTYSNNNQNQQSSNAIIYNTQQPVIVISNTSTTANVTVLGNEEVTGDLLVDHDVTFIGNVSAVADAGYF